MSSGGRRALARGLGGKDDRDGNGGHYTAHGTPLARARIAHRAGRHADRTRIVRVPRLFPAGAGVPFSRQPGVGPHAVYLSPRYPRGGEFRPKVGSICGRITGSEP